MKNIKIIAMTLTLMTTFTFADFTIKDLFISGGTPSTENVKDGAKNDKKERTHQDCM